MTRFDFTQSIENTLTYFFPELENKKMEDCVTVEYGNTNWLILSITFHKFAFDSRCFTDALRKFDRFLELYEILSLENHVNPSNNLISHKANEDKETETYYYKVPITIAQVFSS